MKQLVEFSLSDDHSILIEVDESATTGARPISRNGVKIVEAKKTFEQALANIYPMVKVIKKKFDEMEDAADEVEVKFGVKLSGQAGAIITIGEEACYEITMRWTKDNK